MDTSFQIFPEQASAGAVQVDRVYFFLLAVAAFFTVLICAAILYFVVRYRRGTAVDRSNPRTKHIPLEITWTVVPLALTMVMFFWGAKLFFDENRPPADAVEIAVVAKQWMWKLQHPQGKQEIDELHLPVGRAVTLRMISEDVIHSFYVPAFRVKKDVLPGRYSSIWFQPIKAGVYHLFCAEYCGTSHSRMIGRVVVQEPAEFADWLRGATGESPQVRGRRLFEQFRCGTCHKNEEGSRCPPLEGLFGKKVPLQGGRTVVADEDYLRESIIDPSAKVVTGYQPLMPTFQGQIGEEGVLSLVAYIKSLKRLKREHRMNRERRPLNYLNARHTVGSWLLTTDHKRIAILYMVSVTFFFFIGGAAAVLFRLELMTPPGDLVLSETYNKLFTLHGVVMVFFFLIPSIPAVLGNFLIPMMLGARDLALPKLNLLSWYIFMAGGLLSVAAIVLGGVDTGWTFYTPYSSTYSNSHVTTMAMGIFVTGFSSILTGLNFIVTTHTMRAPGLTWSRLPLFVWAHYATSIIMVLGTPVIAITLLLIALERGLRIGIFDPKLGGDPLLFQHLFWFYSHPAVYIMVLPSMGVISEIVTCFARKKIFGYSFIAFSSIAIAVLGFLVWGHHMFVSGQSEYAGFIFSFLSMMVAIPSAIKVFNWTATLHKGSVTLTTPMLYALGFIGLFTIGGLTGLFLATLAVDVHVHDTYFVVAHFHYIMVGGAVMGYLGGIHFWWPKISGRLYNEWWGRFSAVIIFFGFNLTFFPQFVLGYLGMPRRYHAYPPEFQVLNVMSSAGASILGVGYLIPLAYLLYSAFYGARAGDNPWDAKGLEWETPSPPPTDNFEVMPIVTDDAYPYNSEPVNAA